MPAKGFYRLLREKIAARDDLVYSEVPLRYQAGEWQFARIASKEIGSDDKVILVRGTIHGDEIAGALTILNYFDELVEYAHSKGVKLIIYPLGNPSGFERGTRYNADNDKGVGNNDFLRYVMPDGSIEGDLGAGRPFTRWLMSDSPELSIRLPLEAKLTQEMVRREPLDQVAAAVDLHQDYLTEGLPPCAYHYVYGDVSIYQSIADQIAIVVPPLKHFDMDAGYNEQIDEQGRVTPRAIGGGVLSDEDGFITRYDGSFSDFFYRRGIKYSVATETSRATPLEKACLVNWIWLMGVIDLVARA